MVGRKQKLYKLVRVTEGSKYSVLINYYFPGPQVVQGLSTEAGILETKSLPGVVW